MKKLFTNRHFIASFFFTLIIIFFIAALLYVDKVQRSLLLGIHTPPFSLIKESGSAFLYIGAFGINKTYDISTFYTIIKAICDFVCIPI